jgi:HlyD family secretion protein
LIRKFAKQRMGYNPIFCFAYNLLHQFFLLQLYGMKKSFVKKYLWNKFTVIWVVILVIALYFLFFRGSNVAKFDYAVATLGDVVERVSVTGKISPVEKADLAFEKGGRVTTIKVKIGDLVRKGDLLASLDMSADMASLVSAQAKLADLSRGLNDPELALEQSKIKTASVALANAKQDAINATRTALAQTQGALYNYTDIFFDNPQSVNPTINIQTPSQTIYSAVNLQRLIVSETLNKWRQELSAVSSSDDALKLIGNVNSYEAVVKDFMDRLSSIVNDLDTGSSGLSRSTIDAYVTSMNTGLSTFNQAVTSISTAKTTLENAISNYDQTYNNFLLKNSGSSAQAVAAQTATVELYRAELAKGKLFSPIDGIVTRIEPEIGEYVSPGSLAFSVISDGEYKVEAYVPEADIAKISIGDQASTTLDAYGQSTDFPVVVYAIDPAETVLEGVPTYRVIFKFVYKDERIRSGMTANLDIKTNESRGVVVVPTRAVIGKNGSRTIRIVDAIGKNFTPVPIKVGLKGSDGTTEIVSGVAVGDKVVTYVK